MDTTAAIEAVYRAEAGRVLATLVRLLGGFDLAEEALHDACVAAAARWPRDGVPANPRAWLVSAGRFQAIDKLRRRARFDASQAELVRRIEGDVQDASDAEAELTLADDQLRLIFVCCHPALAPDAQVALTLREVCGLTTEEIAAAFFSTAPTIAQRIVRAKAKIRDAKIPYEVPDAKALPERLEVVLRVVYLLFNEGYLASSGPGMTRVDLSAEAIRLARLLASLLPAEPEISGLLALMLLHDARRAARTGPGDQLVPLAEQDRSLWNRDQIAEGAALVRQLLSGRFGQYAVQAAIAAEHARAPSSDATDWQRIVHYYDLLLALDASDVVELNRAVAVSMRDGPQAALELVGAIAGRGGLQDYYLLHATRADLLQRLGRHDAARVAYERALALTQQGAERQFLQRRLTELPDPKP